MSQFDPSQVKRLIDAAGPSKTPIWSDVQAQDYDWYAPSRFGPSQMGRLRTLADAAAEKIADAARKSIPSLPGLAVFSVEQLYGQKVQEEAGAGWFFLALNDDSGSPRGFVQLRHFYAVECVGRLLGGAAGGKADRKLSSLESALLRDVLDTQVQAFVQLLKAANAPVLRAGAELLTQPPLAIAETAEFCRLCYKCDPEATEPVMLWVVKSEVLDPVAGLEIADTGGLKPNEIKIAMVGHLEHALIAATVWAGQASMPMGEIVAMEPGDVIMLDKRVDDPLTVDVQGQGLLEGTLAQSEGMYALQIVKKGS